jgi:signal transduction histidine kinase
MIAAMSILRTELSRRVRVLGLAETGAKLNAVHKLLDLELTMMLRTYHEEASEQIRAAERAQVQVRLAESEHLANVGQLAATLAHEIKNPLAGISGAIQVIGSSLPPGSPHKEVVGEVLSEIDRLDATARDLLIYARPKPPLRKKRQVGPLLRDTLMLLRQEPAVHGLRIRYDGLECAAEALLDETQFKQVVSNLLLNAAHACEKGGEVTFRVSSEAGIVRVEVIDTGIGMPADMVLHTFEPFYTTKAKGTGLGLSICKWIVESHGGKIRLESEPDQGTTVTIELPHKP